MARHRFLLALGLPFFVASSLTAEPQCRRERERKALTAAPAWMAGFLKRALNNELTVACGGVVVDVVKEGHGFQVSVLTALHCLKSAPEAIILGRAKFAPEDQAIPIDLTDKKITEALIGDLALVSVPVPPNHEPMPVPLPARTLQAAKDTSLTFYSWGLWQGKSNRLWSYAGLAAVSDEDCQKAREDFPYPDSVSEVGYCAGLAGYELVTFDSGGALVSNGSLVGIASESHCWVGRFSDPIWRVPHEDQLVTLPYERLASCTRESRPNEDPFVSCSPTLGGKPVIGGRSGTLMPTDRLLSRNQRKLLEDALRSTKVSVKATPEEKR